MYIAEARVMNPRQLYNTKNILTKLSYIYETRYIIENQNLVTNVTDNISGKNVPKYSTKQKFSIKFTFYL